MNWTEERVEHLKWLNDRGDSASQIGIALGVTRSCVMGKMRRKGIPMTNALGPRNENGAGRRKPSQAARADRKQQNVVRPIARAPGPGHVEQPPPPSIDIPLKQRRTLFELETHHCRFPIGAPGTPDFAFCGGQAVEGLPYCIGHCRIAYQAPERRTRNAPAFYSARSQAA